MDGQPDKPEQQADAAAPSTTPEEGQRTLDSMSTTPQQQQQQQAGSDIQSTSDTAPSGSPPPMPNIEPPRPVSPEIMMSQLLRQMQDETIADVERQLAWLEALEAQEAEYRLQLAHLREERARQDDRIRLLSAVTMAWLLSVGRNGPYRQ